MSEPKKNYKKFIFVVFFILCSSLFFAEGFQLAESKKSFSFLENGLVTAVYDGDTIKVRFENGLEKIVRLIGVDSAEIGDPGQEIKFQAYMAKRFTFSCLYLRMIKLEYEQEIEDKYGRILAYVWTERQGFFNRFILEEGFASSYLYFPFRYRKEFIKAEEEARRLEKGLWRKRPYPSVQASEAGAYIGKLASVQCRCAGVMSQGRYVFLHSSGDEFSALIPQENISLFPELNSFEGKELSVTGFIEEYKGKPQVFVFLPMQIEIRTR